MNIIDLWKSQEDKVIKFAFPVLFVVIVLSLLIFGIIGSLAGILLLVLLPTLFIVSYLLYLFLKEKGVDGGSNERVTDLEFQLLAKDNEILRLQGELDLAVPKKLKIGAGVDGEAAKPKVTVESLLAQVDELRAKPRVTAKMVMKPAAKLEKMKNKVEHRDNIELQANIRTALNWCYEQIGDVQYDVEANEKKILKRTGETDGTGAASDAKK